jgi:hypothetical protein
MKAIFNTDGDGICKDRGRQPLSGEYALETTPRQWAHGYNPAYYRDNGGVFEPRPQSEINAIIAAEQIEQAKAQIAAERYERECTSLLFDGYYFKMYPSDRNLMFQAFFTLVNGLATSIHWKCENGWYELTPSNVTALYAAVQTQVESAFAWEEAQITALEE